MILCTRQERCSPTGQLMPSQRSHTHIFTCQGLDLLTGLVAPTGLDVARHQPSSGERWSSLSLSSQMQYELPLPPSRRRGSSLTKHKRECDRLLPSCVVTKEMILRKA